MSAVSSPECLPAISVLMPAYNVARYVAEAIESVLAQTFTDFEFLVLDDGSSDGTLDILQSYARKDPRVRVIVREHRGIPRSRNELLSLARGEFIAWMDGDDVSFGTRIEAQVKELRRTPDLILIGSFYEIIDAAGRPISRIRTPCEHADIDAHLIRGHCVILQGAAMARRSAMIAAGGYAEDYPVGEDIQLWLRLAEIGRVASVPNVLLRVRLRDDSVSSSQGPLQQRLTRKACEAAWARRGIGGTFDVDRPSRAGKDVASRHVFALQYGWMAWNQYFRKTWLHYALRALRLRPFAVDSWKLLIFGMLRRPAGPGVRLQAQDTVEPRL